MPIGDCAAIEDCVSTGLSESPRKILTLDRGVLVRLLTEKFAETLVDALKRFESCDNETVR